MSRPAVIVMIKAPQPGLAKTRLTPPLSERDAARLATCFIQDTVTSINRIATHLIIAYTPSDGRIALESLLGPQLLWIEQRGADLGVRLERAAAHAFDAGFGPVILIGADSPTLPTSFVTQAIQSLARAEADIALGPAEDGGYYLIGLRHHASGIFQNIAWSTPQAYEQTARNAEQLGLRLLELPHWYDIDTPSDLVRLRAEFFSDDEARLRAPATYQWLKERDEE